MPESQIFALPSEVRAPKIGYADIPPGTRHPKTGRYRMPLLPGDVSPKSVPPGQDPWVSYGVQSMTNLAASISDTKALGIWETRQALIGIGLHPELAQELTIVVYRAKDAGVDFQDLRSHPDFTAELDAVIERAKDISGANAARDAGIAMHDEWELRGTSQQQGGAYNAQLDQLEALLDAAGFDRVPELRERTVRNVTVNAAGRFDDILLHRKSGKLYMADLKSKRKKFWTWLEMDAQLAGYARSEWMLEWYSNGTGEPFCRYIPGPVHHVDLTEGVILHMPSGPDEEGKQEPRLRRADLTRGWRALQLARQVCDVRSDGKSAGRERESYWPVG